MLPEDPRIVVWREDGMPASPRFSDVYRSRGLEGDAGLAQARHVFLQGCGLIADQGTTTWANTRAWQVLETGFGLGLNFLATWNAWRADPARPQRLFYSAVEAWPPEAEHILRSAEPFDELKPLARELANQWHGLLPGLHRLQFEEGRIQLTLAVGEAQPMLAELTGQFDSIFLDGFSPARNPDMWSLHTLKAVTRLAKRGARAASWCVAGEVRERLITCGFSVERVPGLPPKRHALRATFEPRWQPKLRAHAPSIALPTGDSPLRCTVIGGGLAGASCAYSLAQRGWNVTVLDSAAEPAAGASGLPAGVVAPHVSPDDRPLSRLTRAGARATLMRAEVLLREGVDFAPTGVLERHAPGERRLPASWLEPGGTCSTRADTHAANDALTIEKAGQAFVPLSDTERALWHDHAGWIRPAALVRAMLASAGIEWHGDCRAERIESTSSGSWRVLAGGGAVLAESELVVIAAGFQSKGLLTAPGEDSALPLHALRGQVAFGPMPVGDVRASIPSFPVNGHGSLIGHIPHSNGSIWVTGSTFERGNTRAELSDADHAHNRQRLKELIPAAAEVLDQQWTDGQANSWAAVRATLPDRLPAVGAWDTVTSESSNLDAPEKAPLPLQVCTGLGARGLTLAVLSGEIMAAWLHGEPLPVERGLAARLTASRWQR